MATKAEEMFQKIGASIPDAKVSKMFGCPCIKSPNGKASVLLWRDNLVVKPPKESLEDMLKSGYEMFTPAEGKSMNGWVVIPTAQSAKWKKLAEEAYDYVSALPANK
jgi:hypothetical protein